jgi:hypothetical protein
MLKRILAAKVALWMIVIGAAVLLLPHAAWPRWSGWLLLAAGALLAPLSLLAGRRHRAEAPVEAPGDGGTPGAG